MRSDAGAAPRPRPPLGPVAQAALARLRATKDPDDKAHVWYLYLMARARDFGIAA